MASLGSFPMDPSLGLHQLPPGAAVYPVAPHPHLGHHYQHQLYDAAGVSMGAGAGSMGSMGMGSMGMPHLPQQPHHQSAPKGGFAPNPLASTSAAGFTPSSMGGMGAGAGAGQLPHAAQQQPQQHQSASAGGFAPTSAGFTSPGPHPHLPATSAGFTSSGPHLPATSAAFLPNPLASTSSAGFTPSSMGGMGAGAGAGAGQLPHLAQQQQQPHHQSASAGGGFAPALASMSSGVTPSLHAPQQRNQSASASGFTPTLASTSSAGPHLSAPHVPASDVTSDAAMPQDPAAA
jgi:hypothetical protein